MISLGNSWVEVEFGYIDSDRNLRHPLMLEFFELTILSENLCRCRVTSYYIFNYFGFYSIRGSMGRGMEAAISEIIN